MMDEGEIVAHLRRRAEAASQKFVSDIYGEYSSVAPVEAGRRCV